MIGLTLGRYITARFLVTVLATFAVIFTLIFLIDYVELLRRAGDRPGNTSLVLALVSALRTPSIAEKLFPFIVLGAAMITLVGLTRRLELVVARSVGVSVWQFMTPVVVTALVLGILATTVYNPAAALLKMQADAIETRITGRALRTSADQGIWLRQRSVDGQSILRAEQASDRGTLLAAVSAFVFDKDGKFVERVDAERGRLVSGAWQLLKARVNVPGEAPRPVEAYMLATNLTAEQVTRALIPADAVPFWQLPDVASRSEQAGVDATRYKLRLQELLARPLLLVAMVLIAACFSLRFFRFGGIARMVSGGVVSGFVLYVVTKLAADLGGAGILSAPVAGWSPAIVGSMLGVLVLLHTEDG